MAIQMNYAAGNDYSRMEKLQEQAEARREEAQRKAEEARQSGKPGQAGKAEDVRGEGAFGGIPRDEYIPSGQSTKPSGLYSLGKDENGEPKIVYDDPKKGGDAPAPIKGKDDKEEKCNANTDRVDREIEKLKEEKKKLEQEIKAAAGDEDKVKELKQKLASVESELQQKDNDEYRKKNTDFQQVQ